MPWKRTRLHKRLLGVVSAGALVAATATAVPAATSAPAEGTDLASGAPASASSENWPYEAVHVTDGDPDTYWESTNHELPQWAQVDLGAATDVEQVVLRLPNSWEERTQTLTVEGSTDGTEFDTIVPSDAYVFDPDDGNAVTIDMSETTTRYVRVHVTENTGWPAAQLSALEVYGPDDGNGDDGGEGDGSNLAAGRPIDASSHVHVFEAGNANDGDLTTYWEGAPGAYPGTLTVDLGANADISEVTVALDPDPVWEARTQTFEILGRDQNSDEFTTLVPEADYDFDPATGNTISVPVDATVADVRLEFTGNTGAPNGQVAELGVIGTPGANPDLTVTDMSWSPVEPVETDELTLEATVENAGDASSAGTSVDLHVDGAVAANVDLDALDAGASTTVTADVGALGAGSHEIGAEADPDGQVIERDESNNGYVHGEPVVIGEIETSDLVPDVTWTPDSPGSGDAVEFSVALSNEGSIATTGGPHEITLVIEDGSTGDVLQTLTGTHSGVIEPGETAAPVVLGTWDAGDGRHAVTVEVEADGNEHAVKRDNNTASTSLFAGRGANLPYDIYQAQDAETGGGADIVGPNREVGDGAGEASGRQAVTLENTGDYVEFTTRMDTNTLVVRASIPDAPEGGGITDTLNIYVDGEYIKPITLTSRYSWLYGDEADPGTSPSLGPPRNIYDEANVMFDTTIPAGSTIRLQKDPENTTTYAVDFISVEQVEPEPNPDPDRYIEPDGYSHNDVQNALDQVRMDTSGDLDGVYLPPGDYETAQKFQVYGEPIEIIGAGPWFTRFYAPQDQENTDVGFRVDSSVNGSTFRGFAYFGNYTSRIDGPGKVFDFQNVSDITIDDVWVEHMVCMYWGTNVDNMTITNARMRNLWADGLNMTNGSSGNVVRNVEARGTGDDSFALFAATDSGGGEQTGNVYENLTSMLPWRAAGLAVYGGYDNTFRNIHIEDTLVYSGVTISSLDFGYPMEGFGADPPTVFENISIERAGGNFWGGQTFPGMWLFSASEAFQGIRVNDVDIIDPTYAGIMFQTHYEGGEPVNPVTDTVFDNISITGAQLSGDEYEDRSGIGIWVNEMPEEGQGPAVGSATFRNLHLEDNHEDIRNNTDTFDLVIED
ncbi:discoidin domain-containing protein [Phytoactinopolyspora halophila]|uniref:discoidin domain-containing protein n=1 Tax=Phytoactinopolyspora halophila TaxID=1981511 RepID=UPI001B8BB593|nr:discoidin domain-containing protein [Phytoactinopolyspora halophila]